jgi:hypothetical protein
MCFWNYVLFKLHNVSHAPWMGSLANSLLTTCRESSPSLLTQAKMIHAVSANWIFSDLPADSIANTRRAYLKLAWNYNIQNLINMN